MPLVSAIVSGLLGRKIGREGAGRITIASMLITWLTAIYIFYEVVMKKTECYIKLTKWVLVDLGLQFDGLTAIMCVVVTSISLLVHIYSTEYMGEDPHKPRFMAYLSLFTWFMLILVTADNLMQMFIGWEGVGLCSYLLINYWYTRIQANKAAIQAMIVNRIGDLGIVIAIIISYTQYRTLEYAVLIPIVEGKEIEVIGLMILLGAIGKSAQIGLHVWLANAMEGWNKRAWALQEQKLCYMREHPVQILRSSLFEIEGFGKIQRSGQSAGNRKISGTSETTRKAYDKKYEEWLIGFIEGDGSLIVNKSGYLEFKITQLSRDAQLLFNIKKTLGFGSVTKQSKMSNTHHYRVRDKEGLEKIIEILNGNLQLKKRQDQFREFVEGFNKLYGTAIQIKPIQDLISLDKAWIAGFAEAEGYFTAGVWEEKNEGKRTVQITLRFIISQQGELEVLERIGGLLGGKVSKVESAARELKDGTSRPTYLGHNMTVNLIYLKTVIEYWRKNPLKSKKDLSYKKWLEIYDQVISNKHREKVGRIYEYKWEVIEAIKQEVEKLKKYNRENGDSENPENPEPRTHNQDR